MSYSILCDIGQVIVFFDFGLSVDRIESLCSIPGDEIFDRVMSMKDELESGRITPDDFLDRATDAIGYEGSRVQLLRAFTEVFEPNARMIRLLEDEHARGIPLYLISNTNGIHVPHLFARYPVFQLFSGGVYSHEVGAMKPESAIYEAAYKTFGLDPPRTIYIDDIEENCRAGVDHGFLALRYEAGDDDAFVRSFEAAKNSLLG